MTRRLVPGLAALALMGWAAAQGLGCERADASAPRRAAVGPFLCTEAGCVQRHPARPDDGEWDCVESAAAVLCRGGLPAAGVVAGPPAPGWRCGQRRGTSERLCLDLAPALPEPNEHWTCETGGRARLERHCVRAPSESRLGSPCASGADCPSKAQCQAGRCRLSHSELPDCWLDSDCASGETCRVGVCADAG